MADGYLNFDTKINEKGFNEGVGKLSKLGKSGLSIVSKAMTGAVFAVGTAAAGTARRWYRRNSVRKEKERMNDMVTFMASRIIEEAEKSVEAGQKKYRAYFVKTRLYKRWKDNVDTILKTDGYDEVIVEN